jgi:hypothetical protein
MTNNPSIWSNVEPLDPADKACFLLGVISLYELLFRYYSKSQSDKSPAWRHIADELGLDGARVFQIRNDVLSDIDFYRRIRDNPNASRSS